METDPNRFFLGRHCNCAPWWHSRIALLMRLYNALNSRHSYKNAWSNERSIRDATADGRLANDQKSVDALIARRAELEQIQIRLKEDPFG